MRIFKVGGKDWMLRIDAPSILAIRSEHSIDLGGVECFDALTVDSVKCQQVIWSLCRKQAESAGISEASFFELLADGDVGEQAALQLFEAVIDFFPSSQRAGLRKMLAANWEAVQAAGEMVAQRVEAEASSGTLKAQLMAEAKARLDEIFSPSTPRVSAIGSQESSGARSKVARSAS